MTPAPLGMAVMTSIRSGLSVIEPLLGVARHRDAEAHFRVSLVPCSNRRISSEDVAIRLYPPIWSVRRLVTRGSLSPS
jgi:hypothetical protein